MAKKGVDANSFTGQSTITSADFRGECFYIGENAFSGCTSLSEINENNVLEAIYECGFKQTKLKSATFSKLKQLGNDAFSECVELTNVKMPICESIPDGAFYECEKLKEIDIKPSTVGKKAFYSCVNLNKIDLSKCEEIHSEAFKGCKKIQDLSLPECTTIKGGAFSNCSNLRKVSLYKCGKIFSNAFVGCENLRAVYIYNDPECFCYLSNNVFCDCTDLTSSCNSSIYFYIDKSVIEKYRSDSYWSHYATYMLPFVEENQILYRTNDGKNIKDAWENYINISNHTYGLLEFDSIVDHLCECMFLNASNLIHIDLSSKCKVIGKNAFENCINLNIINYDVVDGFTQIDDYAFKNCESLTSFIIPDLTEIMGEGVFAGCKNINEFEGKFVTYNGKAIVYKSKLICLLPNDDSITEGRIYKTSDIDSDITILGKSCFYGCEKMRRIDISDNIKEIHDNAFDGCINLCEIHMLSKEPPILGENVLNGVRDDVKIFVPEDALKSYVSKWSQYKSNIYPTPSNDSLIYYSSKIQYVPNQTEISIDGYGTYWKVSGIGESLNDYFKATTVEKVILGEGIKKLNTNAFKNCHNLNYIYISDSVNTFGDGCFNGCEKLNRIHIPCNLTESQYNIFEGCTNLKEFGTYYKGYVSDDNRCYIKNNILKFFAQSGVDDSYSIPDSITEIASFAFKGCSIKDIKISKNTKKIGTSAFEGCNRLNKISNFTGVKYINNSAFRDCIELENINFSNYLESIGDYAFYNCKKYKGSLFNDSDSDSDLGSSDHDRSIEQYNYFYMPVSIKNLGSSCFKNTGLENLYIYGTSNLTTLPESAFEGCSYMKYIAIDGSNIKSIEKNTFKNCGIDINELSLPSTIESIKDGAFENCIIGEVRLPNSLNFLGNNCLNKVEKVHIYKYSTNPPKFSTTNSKPFNTSIVQMYAYTENAYNAYSTNDYWKQYKNCMTLVYGNANITFINDGCDVGCQYTIEHVTDDLKFKTLYSVNNRSSKDILGTNKIPENHTIRIYPSNDMSNMKGAKMVISSSGFNYDSLPTITEHLHQDNSMTGNGHIEFDVEGDVYIGDMWATICFESDNRFGDTDGKIYIRLLLNN